MKKLFLPLVALLLSITAAIGQTITGPTSACVGSNTTLTGLPGGGTWSCTAPGIITPGGVITGTVAGMSMVTYSTGSGSAVVPFTLNPNPSPLLYPNIPLCGSITMTSSPAGGTWSSSNPGVVAINATTGVATAMSAPGSSAFITYTLPTGCRATATASVDPASVSVTGIQRICAGSSTPFTATGASGVWSSSTPVVATVSASGIVTAVSLGTATISYTPSCGVSFTKVVTVVATGAAGPITGSTSVCAGGFTTLSCSPAGGTWSSSNTSVASVFSGSVIYGATPGTATISYVYAACPSGMASAVATVSAPPSSCPGSPSVCVGSSVTLTCPGTGVTWSGGSPLASVTPTGVVTGLSQGWAILTYTNSAGCFTTDSVSVLYAPSAISGTTSLCVGATSTLSAFPGGGMWGTSSPAIATVSSAGVVTAVASGTALITYGLTTGCSSSVIVTVGTGSGSITISSVPVTCGSSYVLTASGGGGYTWSPSAGLACASCPSITVNPLVTTTYVVSGSIGGCTGSATMSVGGANRIYGHINFAMGMPSSPTCKVWLVQYNPLDSSITALDSVLTCMDGGTPYYQFNGVPSGNYFVKAKLLSSVTGTSGYVPTYGTSTPNWYAATNIAHGSSSNVQNITMVYGTVPAGPGFISGYVYAGAGKGTSGDAPVAGMLIYLRNNAGVVLSHTYTDASGAYTFSGLGNGSYVIYPEEYDYYTTPSSILTLSAATPNVAGVNFKQHTSNGTITPLPIVVNGVNNVVTNSNITVYPNPASGNVFVQWNNQENGNADVVITDVLGREVYRSTISVMTASGESELNVHGLNAGVYSVSIKTNASTHIERLLIQK